MEEQLKINRDVWENMFDWLNKSGKSRVYPNETVVIWLKGYAKVEQQPKRILDIGCGYSQCIPLFMNEGFDYWGIDVTSEAFSAKDQIEKSSWKGRIHLSVFHPPELSFEDNYFSHIISMEALHLNSSQNSMRKIITEIHRVLKPGGRFLATVMRPDYWIIDSGGADWITPETIKVNEKHSEVARRGATYFVFKDEKLINDYFSIFKKCWIGHESRVFGENKNKFISHWIISTEK